MIQGQCSVEQERKSVNNEDQIDIKCMRAAELHNGICRGVQKSEISDAKHLSINLDNDIRSLWLLGLYVALACFIGVDMVCVWLRNITPFWILMKYCLAICALVQMARVYTHYPLKSLLEYECIIHNMPKHPSTKTWHHLFGGMSHENSST